MQNKTLVWALVGVVVLLLVVVLIVQHKSSTQTQQTSSATTTDSTTASTTTTNLGNGIQVTGPAGAKVTITPVTASSVQAPNLAHVVSYAANLPSDAVIMLKNDIASTTASLKKNASQGEVWLQLAVYYKIAGDFPAAEAVWIYMTKVAPSNEVAFQDLGDLYQNFVVNYPKAEANYLQVLKLDPKNIGVYGDLYTLYKYQYKTNTTAAADIVAQGLKANPNNPDLLALQKQLQSGK